jgi:hypothetical protein
MNINIQQYLEPDAMNVGKRFQKLIPGSSFKNEKIIKGIKLGGKDDDGFAGSRASLERWKEGKEDLEVTPLSMTAEE